MRLHRMMLWSCLASAACGLLGAQDQPDPPSRVARLSYLGGSVSFRPASVDEWTAATLNYPLTTGDHLWTDQGAGADIHIGSNAIHLADQTAFAFLNLDDRTAQISLTQGAINIRLALLESDETFEVDTPNGAVVLLRGGDYRIDVNGGANSSAVVVRAGEAEVTGGGQALPVHSRQMLRFSGTDQLTAESLSAPAPDQFDQWCMDRDRREERALQASANYVPPQMAGAGDLAGYGVWRNDPGYGAVWVPSGLPMGWEPYRFGHWAYIAPWGWTWIDDMPWGFAPFHYGRWAMVGGGWVWIPGARVARPVYAPALVAFVGGSGFSVALGIGGGGVAWIPLGPREVYRPYYRVSETYVRNVNVTHVTNINVTNVNVTNVTYVNRTHVTAVSQTTFAGARPVAAAAVRVPPEAITRVQVVNTVDVRPARESYMGRPAQPGMRFGTPPAQVATRTVVVKQAPPPVVRPMGGGVRVADPVRSNGVQYGNQPAVNRPVQNAAPQNANPQNANPQNALPQVQTGRPTRNDRPPNNNAPAVNQPRPATQTPQTEMARPPRNNPPTYTRPPVNNQPPPNASQPQMQRRQPEQQQQQQQQQQRSQRNQDRRENQSKQRDEKKQ